MTKRMRICAAIAATVAITACPLIAEAGTLQGTITDRSNGEALLSATIMVESDAPGTEPQGTVTDNDGNFKIEEIPPGEYSITVSYIGFVAHKVNGVVINETDTHQLNESLIPVAINTGTITVSTSRSPEKILEAPASVSVVNAENLETRTSLTPSEHLKGISAVDVATTGLNQSNVVVRGFNNIFSGTMLVLIDNRIARVPSLRYNAYNFISTVNEDMERIEVVSGPGSALYGPNSASGVMHIITKSPFASKGTTVSLGGGERDVVVGSFRHANTIGTRVGYKISGQYYQGNDWESYDEAEPDSVAKFRITPEGREYSNDSTVVSNARDFDIEKFSAEGRMDFLFRKNWSLIVNGGFNQGSSIELTGLGAGQAIDWRYSYAQARLNYKDLFIQGFVNASDAGDTYLLWTGQLIVDKSKLWGAQVQHSYAPNDRLSFIYGFDALLTRPNTEGTINGRNEEDDNIDEFGVYLQSEAQLTDQVRLIGAARVDDNNRLEDIIVSPRAALTYQPDDHNNFRVTYNRAYSTPDNNNFYLDILQNSDPFGVGAGFESALGFRPDIDIRVQGVPETGFHWRMGENGPQYRSPFAPAAGMSSTDFIDRHDPMFTNVMWSIGRGAVISGFEAQLAEMGVPQPAIDVLSMSMNAVTPSMLAGLHDTLMTFNPNTRSFDAASMADIADIERLKPTITQTIELGYKGVLGDRLKFSVDAYRTQKYDFIGPLTIETPNVFLDPATLSNSLSQAYAQALADPENADYAAALAALDSEAYGGNENGTPIDELTTMFTTGAASIPFGTFSPEEALNPEALLVTYRNFGDISFYGADLAFAYHLHRNWNVGGSYSYIRKNLWSEDDEEGQVHDIHLNAPKHKFGLFVQYANPKIGFTGDARLRYVDAFEMNSPFVGTTVGTYSVVDLNAGVNLMYDTRLYLTVQNALDYEHIEFVGAPPIGRLAILRLSKSF